VFVAAGPGTLSEPTGRAYASKHALSSARLVGLLIGGIS
jgi:hypothetical protein